jgi:hypothetical protein
MSAVIVTTGVVAGGLLERMVACHLRLRDRGIRVRTAMGGGGAASSARNILLLQNEPVAVVSDADTLTQDVMEEQRGLLEYIVGAGGPVSEWRVLLIAPEVAALLFRDEQLLRSLLPVSPSFEQLIRGRYEPNRVLAEIFAQAGEQPFPGALLRRLNQADLSSLWALAPELRPLEEFLLEKLAAQQPGTAP